MTGWRFEYRPSAALPPLAWMAAIRPPHIVVRCGSSVRREDGGFVEGTWSGAGTLAGLAASPTVFATGIMATGDQLLVVTPSHTLESVYLARRGGGLIVSNSLAGLLEAAGLALDPRVDYPLLFGRIRDGIGQSPITLPTLAEPVAMFFFENVGVSPDGAFATARKPREAPFTAYADYRRRLATVLAALLANAPGYAPLVALSAGYDSTAVAALAAELGCRRAIGFRTSKELGTGNDVADSGADTAQRLGLAITLADRLAYRERSGLPEAEFLAGGMSGEEVVFVAFEEQLRRTVLLTGIWPSYLWSKSAPRMLGLERDDLSGASLTEFRLRVDCLHVPLPFFAATEQRTITAIPAQPDMRPYFVGGSYDRPIPRRIAEEVGIPRGSFALAKRAVSASLHSRDAAAFAPVTLAAIEDFAAHEGRRLEFPDRRRRRRVLRAALRLARALRLGWLAARIEARRRRLTHFDGQVGNLLLRWAVSVVAPRYREDAG